jgi:hypothetical protein
MPASRRSVSRAPRPAGRAPAGGEGLPHRRDVARGQDHLETVLAGVAGARDHPLAHHRGVEGAQPFGRGAHRGIGLPEALARPRALDRDDGQVVAGAEGHARNAALAQAVEPRDVLGGGAGVDHQAEPVLAEEVADEVVDDTALLVEHAGVERLSRNLELRDVVGEGGLQESACARALHFHHLHVGDVEESRVAPHRVVLLDLRAVVDRHVPAAEIDHARAGCAVDLVERRLLGHCGLRSGTKKG